MCRSSLPRCTGSQRVGRHPARIIPSVLAVLGLTLLLGLGVTLATPAPAQAQGFHGIATAKSCDSPVAVGDQYTCSYAVSNTVDTGTGAPGSHDTLIVTGISDTITNTNPPVSSGELLDSFADSQITLSGGATCTPSGTPRTCTLPPGSSIIFGPETFYQVPPVDVDHPTPIQDQLSVGWHDTCDSGANNCNTNAQTATAPGSAVVECGPCSAPNECTTATCNADTGFVCVFAPVEVSTPCTETDNNECTNPGCEVDPNDPTLGVCVQDHTFVPNSTPCTETDGNACTTAGCDGNGTCDQNHEAVICDLPTECQESNTCNPNTGLCEVTNKADSTPCAETDGNACTTAGCDGQGTCDQNHQTVTCPAPTECQVSNTCDTTTGLCVPTNQPDSTPCTETDGNACTTAGCDGNGTCDQNHQTKTCPAPTECQDSNTCDTTTGDCVPTNTPDSTPCGDIDGQACTTAGCDGSGTCDQNHMNTCQAFICRTPGFWGTHGCPETIVDGVVTEVDCEKKTAQNITQAVISATQDQALFVCGEKIVNTALDDAASAVEGICVSPKGAQILQLARQLTALALNCAITTGDGSCANLPVQNLFESCNDLCELGGSVSDITACINTIDCVNNGGTCGIEGLDGLCHDRILVNDSLGLNFEPPGPAGSSQECNDATQNNCTIIGVGEANCAQDSAP
jgi:hypothetical protein